MPAAAVPLSTPSKNGGTDPKWEIGSATLKNISPIPIPALKSIAIHEKSLNSLSASMPPMRILPYLLSAK